MNEVRLTTMHTVIMALMAQSKPVGDFVTKGREVLHRLNMVSFKAAVCSAMLAGVIVSLKNSRFPSKVLGAAASLRLLFRFALGNSLACLPAVDMIAFAFAGALCKCFAANFASVFAGFAAAFYGAIDSAAKMGWRSLKCLVAACAIHCDLFGLRGGAALAGAVAFLRI